MTFFKRRPKVVYDDGEAFAAGDKFRPSFNNDRLILMLSGVDNLIEDDRLRMAVRLVILKAIFGEAEYR